MGHDPLRCCRLRMAPRFAVVLALCALCVCSATAAPVACGTDKDCPVSFCSGHDFVNSYCDPRARLCAMQIVVCQDSIDCTVDSCSSSGCHFDASACKCFSDVQCEDGNRCTTDACSYGPYVGVAIAHFGFIFPGTGSASIRRRPAAAATMQTAA